MVDLETMGEVPNSAIMAIGAVAFGVGEVSEITFYQRVSLQSCMDVGLTVTAGTIEWWLKQSASAQADLLVDRVNICQALQSFLFWVDSQCEKVSEVRLWGNGSDFDCVLLTSAARATKTEWPFKFWNHRDLRTLRSLYDLKHEHLNGMRHTALHDAQHQAWLASNILAALEKKDVHYV